MWNLLALPDAPPHDEFLLNKCLDIKVKKLDRFILMFYVFSLVHVDFDVEFLDSLCH